MGILHKELAGHLRMLAHFAEALPIAQRAAMLLQPVRDQSPKEYADAQHEIAQDLEAVGRFREALDAYLEGIRWVPNGGPDNPSWRTFAYTICWTGISLEEWALVREYVEKLSTARSMASVETATLKSLRSELMQLDDGIVKARGELEAAIGLYENNAAQHLEFATIAAELGALEMKEADYAPAAALIDSALDRLKTAELQQTRTGAVLYLLRSALNVTVGAYAEAEEDRRHARQIAVRWVAGNHPMLGRIAFVAGQASERLGHFDAAGQFYEQAIEIGINSLGADSENVLVSKLQLAVLRVATGKVNDGARLANEVERSLARVSKKYPHLEGFKKFADSIIDERSGDLPAAQAAITAAIEHIKLGNPNVSQTLYRPLLQKARLELRAERYAEAEATYAEIGKSGREFFALSPTKKAAAELVKIYALVGLRRPDEALATLRPVIADLAAAHERDPFDRDRSGDLAERAVVRRVYEEYLELSVPDNPNVSESLTAPLQDELFDAAQLAHSSRTGQALDRAADRLLVRLGQAGLAAKRQRALRDLRYLTHAFDSSPAGGGQRVDDATRSVEMARRLERAQQALGKVNHELRKAAPSYGAFLTDKPASIRDIQAKLRAGEAVLTVVSTEKSLISCLVTRKSVRFGRSGIGAAELGRIVADIRKSVSLQGVRYVTDLPEFPVAAAARLYRETIGMFEAELSETRHIIYVPDGQLETIPLSIFVRRFDDKKAAAVDYGKVAWFGSKYAISTLPAVRSLTALRAIPAGQPHARPFIGFGNPNFGGFEGQRGAGFRERFRSASAVDIEQLIGLPALPESVSELTEMSHALKGRVEDLYFGNNATVSAVKASSLDQVDVIAFATHAVVNGEVRGLEEPALILSPTLTESGVEDGVLKASDIAALSIDADWVILSACDTGSDDRTGSERVGSLAEGFFLAGARGLLVSHWAVNSAAVVPLTTGAVAQWSQSRIGKAEALRRSVVQMLEHPRKPYELHPVFWAPFVLMGDGGAPDADG